MRTGLVGGLAGLAMVLLLVAGCASRAGGERAAGGMGNGSATPAERASAATGPGEEAVRPTGLWQRDREAEDGVVILRVQERDGPRAREVNVLAPRGVMQLPYDLSESQANEEATAGSARGRVALDEKGRPRLGPGYRFVRSYRAELDERAQYYVYHVDLNNPTVAENWRALQRARRAERREALAQREGDRLWANRARKLLSAHEEAVFEGEALLRNGDYRAALIPFTRAAELNHGDPACRIFLALARVAVGHDQEAAQAVRKALELQPKLVPMRLDLPQYFPSPAEYGDAVDSLAARLVGQAAPAEQWFLLGFLEFQRGRLDAAHAAFTQAARGLPKDERTRKFLELTQPVRR